MYLATIVIIGLSPLMLPFPYSLRYRYLIQWGKFVLWWLKLTCNLDYRVEGRENVPDETVIIMSKHQSTYETIALQSIFPSQTWILKRELLWVPFFGWGLKMMQAVAIDRKAGKKALKQVIEQGTARLKAGLCVVIFPEGTRTLPGQRRKYAIGGAMLAQKSGFPIIPVAHNAGMFWAKGQFVKNPGTITFVIGPRIDSHGKRADEINQIAEEWIESTSLALSHLGNSASSNIS